MTNQLIDKQHADAQDAHIPAFFKQRRIFVERAADPNHNADRCEDSSTRCATCTRHNAGWRAN